MTTRWPREASVAGRPLSTSPSPPVFEKVATSALTNTSVWGGPGAGEIATAFALVEIIDADDADDEGASLEAGSLDALRAAAAAGARAAQVVRDDAAAVTGRAVAADERTEEEEEASMFKKKRKRREREKKEK